MALVLKHLDDAKELMVEKSRYVPSDFMIRIESFSLLLQSGVDKHECNEFEAGGYKWRLVIHPNGKENEIDNFVSVYLTLVDPFSMGMNWEVYAMFAIFLQDQSSDQFFCKRLPTRRRLDALSHGMGFSKFISHKCFMDPSNGYIVDDSCVFGAEVFVFKRPCVVERLCWMKPAQTFVRTWIVPDFFKLEVCERISDTFECGGKRWFLSVYPKGEPRVVGKSISAFLNIIDPGEHKVKAEFIIRIRNQVQGGNHHQVLSKSRWFSTSNTILGFSDLMPIADFSDPMKGFLVNDSCVLQLELKVQAVTGKARNSKQGSETTIGVPVCLNMFHM